MDTSEEHKELEKDEPDLLKQECDELSLTLGEMKNHVMRLNAELVNQKKRFEKENEKTREMAAFDFITSILPAKDSMETGPDIAMSVKKVPDEPINKVLIVYQKGYMK